MKSIWFCKTFAASTLHMQKQCTRGPQGIEKSTFSMNLHSAGSCTLKLETLLAWFQLCTPLLPTTQIKRKLDFSKDSGPQSHGIHMAKSWDHVFWHWNHRKPCISIRKSLFYCVFLENTMKIQCFFERRCAAFLFKKVWISLKNTLPHAIQCRSFTHRRCGQPQVLYMFHQISRKMLVAPM